jgi:hypothetical protein
MSSEAFDQFVAAASADLTSQYSQILQTAFDLLQRNFLGQDGSVDYDKRLCDTVFTSCTNAQLDGEDFIGIRFRIFVQCLVEQLQGQSEHCVVTFIRGCVPLARSMFPQAFCYFTEPLMHAVASNNTGHLWPARDILLLLVPENGPLHLGILRAMLERGMCKEVEVYADQLATRQYYGLGHLMQNILDLIGPAYASGNVNMLYNLKNLAKLCSDEFEPRNYTIDVLIANELASLMQSTDRVFSDDLVTELDQLLSMDATQISHWNNINHARVCWDDALSQAVEELQVWKAQAATTTTESGLELANLSLSLGAES